MHKPSMDPYQQLDLRDPAIRRHFADALPAMLWILDCWKVRREDGVAGLVSIRQELEVVVHGHFQTTPEDRRQASLLLQPDFDLSSA